MWEESRYFWAVLCKNHWFHCRHNLNFSYRILLAETDAISSTPPVQGRFTVQCDECGREYAYKQSEVLRVEEEHPGSFITHHLFRDGD